MRKSDTLCCLLIYLVVLHGANIALGEPNRESQNENNEAVEAEVKAETDDKITKRRAEIAQTNRDLKLIQSAVLEDLAKKGVTPPEHMVLIPAGSFKMGLDETDLSGLKPAHRVYLEAYWIDQFPVTNATYRACVEAKICRPPMNRPGAMK